MHLFKIQPSSIGEKGLKDLSLLLFILGIALQHRKTQKTRQLRDEEEEGKKR